MRKVTKPSGWKKKPMPTQRTKILLDRTFSIEEIEKIRRDVIPEQMEDKWFIYWSDECLHFHRSWTGICIYIVKFEAIGESYRMIEAEVNRDVEQYSETDDEQDRRIIMFLIDTVLLRQPAKYPRSNLPCDDDVAGQWNLIGRAMQGEYPGVK